MTLSRGLGRVADTIIAASTAAGQLLLAASAVMAVYEVIARFIFSAPSVWGAELVVAFAAAASFLAGAEAMRQDAHIRISLLAAIGSRSLLRVQAIATLVAGLIFLAGLGWGAWTQWVDGTFRFMGERWTPETTGRAWDVPLPPVIRGVLVLGIGLLALALVRVTLLGRPAPCGRSKAH